VLNFFKSIFNFGLGNVLAQVIGFLLIPLYTRYLTPEDYGILEVTTSFSLVLTTLCWMGLPGSVSRNYFDVKDNPEQLNILISTIYISLLGFSIFYGLVSSILIINLNEIIFKGVPFFPFLLISIFSGILMGPSNLMNKLIISRQQSKLSAFTNVVFTFLGLITALVGVVFLKFGLLGIFLSQLLSASLNFGYSLYYLRPNLRLIFDFSVFNNNLKVGSGILLHHLMINFSPFITKYFLATFVTISSLGLFGISLRFIQPLELFFVALTPTYQPIYYRLRAKNSATSVEVLSYIKMILFISIILVSFVSNILMDLIPVLFEKQYHDAAQFIPILSLSLIGKIFYLIFVSELFYQNKTKVVPIITTVGLIMNVVLSLLLINLIGLKGIAWAYSISYLFWGLGAFILNKFFLRVDFPKEIFIASLFCFLAIYLLSSLLTILVFKYIVFGLIVLFFQLKYNVFSFNILSGIVKGNR
jgi:O-antigen/teichoic acid export membrane protein